MSAEADRITAYQAYRHRVVAGSNPALGTTGVEHEPSILIVSVSREDGLAIKKHAEKNATGNLETLLGIDTVAHFSSRGPVSPFYIKPDLVAPGVYINTTSVGGEYSIVSGTSFAAPHVTGAAIALMNKNPNLTPYEIKSIIATTADASGSAGPHAEGAGRLNVTRAFAANTIPSPHQLSTAWVKYATSYSWYLWKIIKFGIACTYIRMAS